MNAPTGQKDAKITSTATRDYSLFVLGDNRPLNPGAHRALRVSLKKHGFLWMYPVVCIRSNGKLLIRDGQHRFHFAKELGLPVWYIVAERDYDVAAFNSTQKPWNVGDYMSRFSLNEDLGESYREALEFSKTYGIHISGAIALLAGTVSYSNVKDIVISGQFEVKDRQWAHATGRTYTGIVASAPMLKGKRCLDACMAVCRVPGFDPDRLFEGLRAHPEAIMTYSTREGYLTMFEKLYNYRKRQLVPLKMRALEELRNRNVFPKNGLPKDDPCLDDFHQDQRHEELASQ